MQKIDKTFYLIIIFISSLFLISIGNFLLYKQDNKSIALTKITTINSLAFSVAWHENRLRDRPLKYPPYPEMPTADRLTFIYGAKSE
jgi:hypothetical protein